MGVVGKVKVRGPNGVFTVDVVDLGDSQTGHSLRIRTPKGIKEFNLVLPSDKRASPLRINTPWGILSIAKDGRNVIEHQSGVSWSGSRSSPGTVTGERYIGQTELDIVRRIEMDLSLTLRITCGRSDLFSGHDSAATRAHIEAVSLSTGQTFTGPEVNLERSVRHRGLSTVDVSYSMQAKAVLTGLPPDAYEVRLKTHGWRGQSEGHLTTGEGSQHTVTCRVWREYTK